MFESSDHLHVLSFSSDQQVCPPRHGHRHRNWRHLLYCLYGHGLWSIIFVIGIIVANVPEVRKLLAMPV